MKAATISSLKASLSSYLQIVKAGEEVLITERGKPMAKIVPLSTEDSKVRAHLGELERSRLVRIGSGRIPKDFWELPRPSDADGATLKALLSEREEPR